MLKSGHVLFLTVVVVGVFVLTGVDDSDAARDGSTADSAVATLFLDCVFLRFFFGAIPHVHEHAYTRTNDSVRAYIRTRRISYGRRGGCRWLKGRLCCCNPLSFFWNTFLALFLRSSFLNKRSCIHTYTRTNSSKCLIGLLRLTCMNVTRTCGNYTRTHVIMHKDRS